MNCAAPLPACSALEIAWMRSPSRWGDVIVAATERGVCLLQFLEDGTDPEKVVAREFPAARVRRAEGANADQMVAWLASAWQASAERAAPSIPLDLHGTDFQKRVWTHLLSLPPGSTTTYSEVARAIGQPRAVRAVASACARNRVALLVPCHRVTRTGGALAGYRWGLERKRALLAAERALGSGGISSASH